MCAFLGAGMRLDTDLGHPRSELFSLEQTKKNALLVYDVTDFGRYENALKIILSQIN